MVLLFIPVVFSYTVVTVETQAATLTLNTAVRSHTNPVCAAVESQPR